MSKISPDAHAIEVAEPSPPSPTTAPFFPALLPASARVSIEWQDLTVSVPDAAAAAAAAAKGGRRSRKTLVHPCSGAVAPGQLLAIMGPSGSGKTTLIDALAGRLQPGKVRGEVSLGGAPRPRDAAAAAEALSYVAQQDSLMGVFTARETLRHALRFAGGYGGAGGSAAHLTAREDEVLAQVGLTAVASTRVGDIFTKGLSGGQLRRLSLGVELVKKPAVLLLDEPTSGLDSASAYGVVAQLKLLAAAGHTVVCTIHQPSSEVRALFDRFLLRPFLVLSRLLLTHHSTRLLVLLSPGVGAIRPLPAALAGPDALLRRRAGGRPVLRRARARLPALLERKQTTARSGAS